MRVRRAVFAFLLGAVGPVAGCAPTSTQAASEPEAPRAKPTLVSDVRVSNVDLRSMRSRIIFTPAMVAIYVKDENGDVSFDRDLSSQGGGSVNTHLRHTAGLADVRMIDFKLVAGTLMVGSEFYKRMDRATLEGTDYFLRLRTSSTEPLWFGTPVSQKFLSWQDPLDADYVVFFNVIGAYRSTAAVRNSTLAGIATGGLLGAIIAGTLSSDKPLATVSVVDLRDGRLVWFKIRTYSDVRNIEEMWRTVEKMIQDLFRDEAVSRIKRSPSSPATPEQ